jgi:hypothetical protein
VAHPAIGQDLGRRRLSRSAFGSGDQRLGQQGGEGQRHGQHEDSPPGRAARAGDAGTEQDDRDHERRAHVQRRHPDPALEEEQRREQEQQPEQARLRRRIGGRLVDRVTTSRPGVSEELGGDCAAHREQRQVDDQRAQPAR